MLLRNQSADELRLFYGPMRLERIDDEPKEVAARKMLSCRNCYPGFQRTPRDTLQG